MKKLLCLILVMVLVTGGSVYAEVGQPSSWALGVVNAVKNQAILDDDFFSGYQSAITRQEFAYLGVKLYEAYTGQTAEIGTASFLDTSDEWALKAKNVGIVGGYPDGTFLPDKNITREELAVLFVNVFKSAGLEYEEGGSDLFADDSEISSWAKSSVYIARANGIISGVGGNRFDAQGNATKEQSLIMFRNGQVSETLITVGDAYEPEIEGNFIVDALYSSKDETVTIDFSNLPFDFDEEVYAVGEFGSDGTEYDKFPAKVGYIYASDEGWQHIDSFDKWDSKGDAVSNVFEWSNSRTSIGGRWFYNADGDLIGTIVFHKLNEGNNRLEFLMPNANILSEERSDFDAWKKLQENTATHYNTADVTILRNQFDPYKYQIFIPGLSSGAYTVDYSIGSDDRSSSLLEYSVRSFNGWILSAYRTEPLLLKSYYYSWLGETKNQIFDYVGMDEYYVYTVRKLDEHETIIGYFDANQLDESKVISEGNDIYYLKMSLASIPADRVSSFVTKTIGLTVSYGNESLTNTTSANKDVLYGPNGAWSSFLTYETRQIGEDAVNVGLDIYMGPMILNNPSELEWEISDDGGYDIKASLVH